ncbi:hypothetical protein [Streptomyces sp. G-G2]|uniref:hypothetical protein n=1 Tax=Streptomyces sp. G-G2 TaxID=3046201 RepID=UPI0024B9977E|nr:hypothetical protein [Streptomyces sp. G-G2]MDJ0385977.1 hypothetical protein [Streptomyces sp. G-G2]
MSIMKANTAPAHGFSATPALTALLPLVTVLPALTAMYADRFNTTVTVMLIAVDLALIAATAGCVGASSAARAAADRARHDEDVLDALEPLAGARS